MKKNVTSNPLFPKVKKQRVKKFWIRKMAKDLKRVRWPDSKKNWESFFKILVFSFIIVAFIFMTTTVFTLLWAYMGVGP